ncbi:trihelix transcription factor ENAP2-like [Gastrolobium bilobum]|uniref:trihelix transcription factor ENAP2-like n=1 Tax=Gastrolobium bilobum TaxID=150636 RepID=UPI002AB080FB|nr:trihelix transcription factor ENAP2-like [Gastrolobium bilobum]
MESIAEAPPHAVTPLSSRPSPSPFHGREDCWSEEATFTLIDAWGERHLELSRGNLRQKHWQEVADAVNARHGRATKARRTDVQCKNRIDTLKKKFKIEKARVFESDDYATAWPYFRRLDFLIGENFPAKKHSPPASGRDRRNSPLLKPPAWAIVPVGPRSGTQKRPPPPDTAVTATATSPASMKNSYFHRNFSAFAAVAAAAAEAEEEEESENWKWRSGSERRKRKKDYWENGYKVVAEAIEKFGEIYERVETEKHKQMVELEKQRMQFAKDLELQRMQLFMETQLQLQKINRSKRSSEADSC